MFMAAAHALADLVNESDILQGSLYPALARIREVSAHIAAAVAYVAYKRGLAIGVGRRRRHCQLSRLGIGG